LLALHSLLLVWYPELFVAWLLGQSGSRGSVPLLSLYRFLRGCGRLLVVVRESWDLDDRMGSAGCRVGFVLEEIVFGVILLSVIGVRVTVSGPWPCQLARQSGSLPLAS
jgi:hypothetical protein